MLLLPARLRSHRLVCLPSILFFAGGGWGWIWVCLSAVDLSCERFYFLLAIGLFHWLLLLSAVRLPRSKCPVRRGAPRRAHPAGPSPEAGRAPGHPCPRGERSAGGAPPPAPQCNYRLSRGGGRGSLRAGVRGGGPGGGAGAGGGGGQGKAGRPPPLPLPPSLPQALVARRLRRRGRRREPQERGHSGHRRPEDDGAGVRGAAPAAPVPLPRSAAGGPVLPERRQVRGVTGRGGTQWGGR